MSAKQQLYAVRRMKTGELHTGYHSRVVPKLYQLGSARQVVNALNNRWGGKAGAENPYEVVPVEITVGDPA